jgi:hypothetical protein
MLVLVLERHGFQQPCSVAMTAPQGVPAEEDLSEKFAQAPFLEDEDEHEDEDET